MKKRGLIIIAVIFIAVVMLAPVPTFAATPPEGEGAKSFAVRDDALSLSRRNERQDRKVIEELTARETDRASGIEGTIRAAEAGEFGWRLMRTGG